MRCSFYWIVLHVKVLGLVVAGWGAMSAVNFHFVLLFSLSSDLQVYDDERLLARDLFTEAHVQAAGGGFGPHSHAGKPRGEADGHTHTHTVYILYVSTGAARISSCGPGIYQLRSFLASACTIEQESWRKWRE